MKQQFGSFFNKPVEELIELRNECDADDEQFFTNSGLEREVWENVGKGVMLTYNEDKVKIFCFLNHGAFGRCFTCLQEVAARWRAVQHAQPLLFIDRILLPSVVYSIRRLARHLNTPQKSVLLFPNATYGLNCLLQNISRNTRITKALTFSTTYGSVKKMASHYLPTVTQVPIPQAAISAWSTPAHTLAWFAAHVHPHIDGQTLVLLEGISSNSAVHWPANQLAAAIKAAHPTSIVIIDGAHELGMVRKDLKGGLMEADAWVTNGHKWFGTPSGVGVVVLNPQSHLRSAVTQPLIISHGATQSILSGTSWHGHVDYAPWLTIPFAVDLWEAHPHLVGDLTQLADEAERLLCTAWGTSPVYPRHLTAPLLRLVRLPRHIQEAFREGDASVLQDVLHHRYAIECPVKKLDGVLYMRVSVFTYNSLADAQTLADAVVHVGAAKM